MPDDRDEFYDPAADTDPYGDPRSEDPTTLAASIRRLTLMGDDPYLSMQVTNIGIVDAFLSDLEGQLLRELIQKDGTPTLAVFVAAQSQMWIFAIYELLRTWKQRNRQVSKLLKDGTIKDYIQKLEQGPAFRHTSAPIRVMQLRQIALVPDAVERLDADLRRVHVTFSRMNMLRIVLAKHEEQGPGNAIANAPGYGRINRWCGAIDFELSRGSAIIGEINHRDIADGLRFIWDEAPPSWEHLKSFDKAMKGPPVDTAGFA